MFGLAIRLERPRHRLPRLIAEGFRLGDVDAFLDGGDHAARILDRLHGLRNRVLGILIKLGRTLDDAVYSLLDLGRNVAHDALDLVADLIDIDAKHAKPTVVRFSH
jgi:hypothetical protein